MTMEGRRPDAFPTQPTLGRLRRSMIPNMLQTKPRVRAVKVTQKRVNCVLSRRLTSCIFQRPVTRVTAHPGNKVRRLVKEDTLQKPQQRCALQRLQGLQACSSEGQLLSPLDFANAIQMPTHRIPGTSAVSAGAGHQKSRPKCTSSPATDWSMFVPLVDMGLSQEFSSGLVTPGDIQRQAWKVKKARRRLAQALQADKIMREEECAAGRPHAEPVEKEEKEEKEEMEVKEEKEEMEEMEMKEEKEEMEVKEEKQVKE